MADNDAMELTPLEAYEEVERLRERLASLKAERDAYKDSHAFLLALTKFLDWKVMAYSTKISAQIVIEQAEALAAGKEKTDG